MPWTSILNKLKAGQIIRMRKDFKVSSYTKNPSNVNVLYYQRFGGLTNYSFKTQLLNMHWVGIVRTPYDFKDGTYEVAFDTTLSSAKVANDEQRPDIKFKYGLGPVVRLKNDDLFDIAEVWVDKIQTAL